MSVLNYCSSPFFVLMNCLNVSFTLFCSHWILQRPHKAYPTELAQFHSADYVEFLHRITPDTQHLYASELTRCMMMIFFSFTDYSPRLCYFHNKIHAAYIACLYLAVKNHVKTWLEHVYDEWTMCHVPNNLWLATVVYMNQTPAAFGQTA